MEVLIFLGITLGGLLGVGGLGSIIYFPARKEWNLLFKRAAEIGRANLSLPSKRQNLEFKSTKELNRIAKDDWEAQYEGKKELALANEVYHTIVRSWNEVEDNYYDGNTEKWFWECQCGLKEFRKNKDAGRNSARRHIELMGGRDENGIRNQGWLTGKGL